VTETPDHPGYETTTDKAHVAGAQAALDATFNAFETGGADDVEARLREELKSAGVTDLGDEWVTRMAAHIRAGEPVIAEVDES
jgi:hypothetical protein